MAINLTIYDGRRFFYQWDTKRYLLTEGLSVGDAIHYDMPNTDEPVALPVFERDGNLICRVPDELLQTTGRFRVWAYVGDGEGYRTVYEKRFKVEDREKPPDYTYVELSTLINFEEVEF